MDQQIKIKTCLHNKLIHDLFSLEIDGPVPVNQMAHSAVLVHVVLHSTLDHQPFLLA